MTDVRLATRVDYPAVLAEHWAKAPDRTAEALLAAVMEAELLFQREAAERTPVGVGGGGGLRGSIQAHTPRRDGDAIVGEVGTPLPYAPAVELGTKPHMPPVMPLILWAEHKLGLEGDEAERAGHAIARAIAKRGTEGAHMFGHALEATEAQMHAIFQRAYARLAETLGGAA